MTRLDEIKERCEKAPKGPWRPQYEDECYWVDNLSGREIADFTQCLNPQNTYEFVAHSRTDIPWLLEQIAIRDKALELSCDLVDKMHPSQGILNPDLKYWLEAAAELAKAKD